MGELHYGWKEFAAIALAISIIGTWARVRYGLGARNDRSDDAPKGIGAIESEPADEGAETRRP